MPKADLSAPPLSEIAVQAVCLSELYTHIHTHTHLFIALCAASNITVLDRWEAANAKLSARSNMVQAKHIKTVSHSYHLCPNSENR